MSESVIQSEILAALGQRPDVRLFRNAQFEGEVLDRRTGRTRHVRAGLGTGTSDLIGWLTIAGRAYFLAVEVKTSTGRASPEQTAFVQQVQHHGGCAFFATSAQQAIEQLTAFIAAHGESHATERHEARTA